MTTNDLRRICFFCSEPIEGKKTLEHIIPNGLLRKLGIQQETLTGNQKAQYSRIKVPAHASCNNEFGSEYESTIISMLDNPDSLYEKIVSEESNTLVMYGPERTTTSLITTWLSKIYYGLFYYDLITTDNPEWKDVCSSIVNNENFNYVQRSYKNGYGFQLPSSLYVFKTSNLNTDLQTLVRPSVILLKTQKLTFVLCINDGFLTKQYLNDDALINLRFRVEAADDADHNFPDHRIALAEILALRSCIPKTPSFISSESQIVNMSQFTMVENPDEYYRIDLELLDKARKEALEIVGIQFIQQHITKF